MPIDQDWFDQVKAAALVPDLPIIDPHQHLWDYPGDRYMLDALLADIDSGDNIVATVYVEASSMYRAGGPEHLAPSGETGFANGIAAPGASGIHGDIRPCKGIVSFADLTFGTMVDAVLEAHRAAAPDRLRGIRHSPAWDRNEAIIGHKNAPQGLMAAATFLEGFSRFRAHDLTFDAWLYHPQIPELTALATAQPDVTVVFDSFGPDCCIFESNFPVDKVSCSYGVMWNAFKRMAEGISADERRALFHDTAARVYRLN